MATRNVVRDGDEVLKKKCRPVTAFNERLWQLLDDMAETLLQYDGLGLAAPQVGILRRAFVALEEPAPLLPPEIGGEGESAPGGGGVGEAEAEETASKVLEFINPEIVEAGGRVKRYEGCLSFPGKFGAIERPEHVRVRAFGRDGQPFEYEASGIMARCLCHETDHLNGVTIDDLAEYFYDPDIPRALDDTLDHEAGGPAGEEAEGPG